jgi:hypothetical protein
MIAIYPDRGTAEAVAVALRERLHVPDAVVHVDEPADRRRTLEAAMEEETAQGWASGIHGFATGSMIRGAVVFGVLFGVVGLILGLPLGYFLFDQADAVLTRLGVGALIGMLFGTVVGALVGGGMAVESPSEPVAGEHGVPLRIDEASDELETVLEEYQPLRIDRFDDGQRVATPVTDRPSGLKGTIEEFEANTRDSRRR